MKRLILAAAISAFATGAFAQGGSIGPNVPAPQFPTMTDEVAPAAAGVFWKCFFSTKCKVKDLDLK